MKHYVMLIFVFVLTAALMTGCGCTGPTMDQTEAPTILPTNEEVTPTTRETTMPTTAATEATTMPTAPSESMDRGNGGLESTTATMEPTETGAQRSMIR